MWSDQIFSSCKSAIYDYETLTFTAAQKRTLIAEIHLSWHSGQYDIKSMNSKQPQIYLPESQSSLKSQTSGLFKMF